ncbi:hypothetical protein PI95_026645 [Hassallia byssoidea VB512170]|uniref:Uncharacterized protein n=1 Tax=Hassallia byssoidea VB512170 TaxID=1304833 RepID=A0A846HFC1_9CYAN|nr:hypothetical protein [Hassalia byssoidea]NEU76036.1 hypothetical protein [Hassalia byssoidea VB512170]
MTDASDIWMIGDRPEDKACAYNADINFMWVDIFRLQFLPGTLEVKQVTPQQIEFLKGVRISENLVNSPGINVILPAE